MQHKLYRVNFVPGHAILEPVPRLKDEGEPAKIVVDLGWGGDLPLPILAKLEEMGERFLGTMPSKDSRVAYYMVTEPTLGR